MGYLFASKASGSLLNRSEDKAILASRVICTQKDFYCRTIVVSSLTQLPKFCKRHLISIFYFPRGKVSQKNDRGRK